MSLSARPAVPGLLRRRGPSGTSATTWPGVPGERRPGPAAVDRRSGLPVRGPGPLVRRAGELAAHSAGQEDLRYLPGPAGVPGVRLVDRRGPEGRVGRDGPEGAAGRAPPQEAAG